MPKTAKVVRIDAASCIGCTKCLPVCPVDAIVGASKQLHVVLTEFCIGCELCLPPCPVDCIQIVTQTVTPEMRQQQAKIAKSRVLIRKTRIHKLKVAKEEADIKSTQDIKSTLNKAINRAKRKPFIWKDEA